ncbi:MAG: hypothetical protein IPO41_06690 [Acidobacteria bacterium]|nr:hypothetical protein [Acidobacteriota bacterium]
MFPLFGEAQPPRSAFGQSPESFRSFVKKATSIPTIIEKMVGNRDILRTVSPKLRTAKNGV